MNDEDREEKRVGVTRALTTALAVIAVAIAYAASVFNVTSEVGLEVVGATIGPLFAVFALGLFTFTANKIVSFAHMTP